MTSPIWVRQDRPKPPVDHNDYFFYARYYRRPRVWWSSNLRSWVVTDRWRFRFYDSWPEAIEAAIRAV